MQWRTCGYWPCFRKKLCLLSSAQLYELNALSVCSSAFFQNGFWIWFVEGWHFSEDFSIASYRFGVILLQEDEIDLITWDQDRDRTCNVASWHICVTTVSMETQQWPLFVLFRYVRRGRQYEILIVPMERQQWPLFVLSTYICRWQKYKMNLGVHIKCPVFLSDFKQIWIFWTDFSKSFQYRTSRTSLRWEPSWYGLPDEQTDRQTGRQTWWS